MYFMALTGGLINTDHIPYFQVFASDADSGMNGQMEYSIVSGNHNDAFILDSVRGILATNVLLDREITPSYKYAKLTHWTATSNLFYGI